LDRSALSGDVWRSAFAVLVTLVAWSQFHVAFVYLQLSYGVHGGHARSIRHQRGRKPSS